MPTQPRTPSYGTPRAPDPSDDDEENQQEQAVISPDQPDPLAGRKFDTALSPRDEAGYLAWKKSVAPNDSGDDYDFRGAYKSSAKPDANGHWPDTYKKPNHPTFSEESVYAKDVPELAGRWVNGVYVPPRGVAPVMPRPSVPGTRAYSRPQPVAQDTGPVIGTTGGIVPQQAGTWDKAPAAPQRWADDPAQRRQQAIQRAEADFEAKQRADNPFLFSGAVKSLAKEGGQQHIRRALRQAEDEYGEQLSLDRAATVEQRRIEAEQRKVGNEAAIQQMLATGQKYRRDEFGNIQPILDARGRPLYTPTKWEKTKHPKTGRPMLGMMNQYRQRQFKAPPLRDSTDPLDDYIYADFGEGASEPYMTKEEAAASDDISLKALGLSAIKKQRAAKANERMSGYRRALDESDREFELAQATMAANRQRAQQIALSGGDPAEAAKLEEEAYKLEEQLKPQGPLALRKLVSRVDLELEQAALRHETRLIQRDEISARVAKTGGTLETDPSYIANEAALADDAAKLEQHKRAREAVGRLMQPVAQAQTVAAPAGEVSTLGGIASVSRRAGRQALAAMDVIGAIARGGKEEEYAQQAALLEQQAANVDQLRPNASPEERKTWADRALKTAGILRQRAAAMGESKGGRLVAASEQLKKARGITGAKAYEDYSQARGAEAVRQFFSNPVEIASNIAAEGAVGSIPSLLLGAAGAATAGAPGLAGGVGLGSFATEYANTVLDTFSGAGIDTANPDSLIKAFGDDRLMSVARKRALARGVPVAVFDALSGGLAGRAVAPVVKNGIKQMLKAGGVEVAEQAGLGMAGEAAGQISGQIADKGKVDLANLNFKDIFAEGIGEVVPGLGEIAIGSVRRGGQRDAATPPPPAPPAETVATEPPPPPAGTLGNAADVSPLDAEQARLEEELLRNDAAAATTVPPDATSNEQPAAAPVTSEPAPATAEVPPVVASEAVPPAAAVEEAGAVGETPSPVGETAPAEFIGIQEGLPALGDRPAVPGIELYNLTQDIPGHPAGSSVSRETLEKAGYFVPPQPTEETQNAVQEQSPSPRVLGAEEPQVELPGVGEGNAVNEEAAGGTAQAVQQALTPTPNAPQAETPRPQQKKAKGAKVPQAGGTVAPVAPAPEQQVAPPSKTAPKSGFGVRKTGSGPKAKYEIFHEASGKTAATADNASQANDIVTGLAETEVDASAAELDRESLVKLARKVVEVKRRQFDEAASGVAPPPSTAELRANNAGIGPPPISSLKADQKLAELKAGGITTYAGKPIEDANPAQLSNALGKFRRGELTAEGEKPGAATQPLSVRAEQALKKLKFDTRDKAFSGETAIAAAAWNTALDLAIVAIKAGRTVAEAVQLAVARYKALHKGATEDDISRLRKAVEDAGSPQSPPSGNGPVNDGGNRKESKSKLGKYDYVATSNADQQKFATGFADAHPDIDEAVKEMRGISEPAMRSATAAELLARTMEKWEKANAAEKPALMAKASAIINDVKADKTEASQALQAQAMVNERLKPFAPLLAWMDLLRTRYQNEVADKVGADAGEKVKQGINQAGQEASEGIADELADDSDAAAKAAKKLLKKHTVPAVDESVADRIMRMLGPLAGYRDFFTKKGVESIAKRISDLAKSPEKEGNVWTFDAIINSELGKILGEGLEKAGLKPAQGQKIPDAERIAQFLSDDALRGDKVKLIDAAVREKIAALPDAMRQQVEEAWDATVGLMSDAPSSATTAKRMVQESLREVKPKWNDVFRAGGIPALRTQVVNDIAAKVASASPGGEKLNLGPLRELIGKSFDEIAAVRKERFDKSEALRMEREAKKAQRKDAAMSDWLSKHASTLNLLRKAAKARDLKWGDIFNGLPEEQDARQQELFDRVRQEPKLANLSEASQKKLAQNLDEAWTYLRNGIFRQEFSRLVQLPNIRPADAAKVRSVIGELIKFSNLGLLDNEAFLSAVAEKYGMERLDGPTATKLTELAGRIQRAKNDSERARAYIEMYEVAAKSRGLSVSDAVMSGFYSNLLNSLVTTAYAMAGGNLINTAWNLGTLAISDPRNVKSGAGAIARGYKTGIPEGLRQALSILVTGHGGEDAAAQLVEARGEPLEMLAKGGVWEEWEKANPRKAKGVQISAHAAKMIPRLARAIDAVFYYPSKQAALRFLTEQTMLADYPDASTRVKKAAELLKVTEADFKAAEKTARDQGFDGLDLSIRIADILEPKSAIAKIEKASETTRYLTEKRNASQAGAIGLSKMDEGRRLGAKTTLSQEPEGWAGVVYDSLSKGVERVRPGGFPVLKMFMPFLRLPTNFYNANLASTPVGLISGIIGSTPTKDWRPGSKARRKFTQNEKNQLYMQSLIGALATFYFVARAMTADPDDEQAFDITANGPADKTLRRQMEGHGWKPKSIRIPGTKTRIDYMNTPMAMPLTIAGHITDAHRFQKKSDELVLGNALLDAAVRFPSVIFGLPALSGLQELGEMLDEDKVDADRVTRFLKRTGKNFARPRLVDEVDRIFDPAVRRDGVIQYDELGQPIERSPLSRIAQTESADPLRQVLLNRKLKIPAAGRDTMIGRERMTPEQYSEYLHFSGQRIKARLDPLVALLKQLPYEQAQKRIDQITGEERDRAKDFIRIRAMAPAKK